MKKKLLFSCMIACTLNALGQQATQWLALTPVQIEKPVLENVKDVDNKIFTADMLLKTNHLNISQFTPELAKPEKQYRSLSWEEARTEQDTVMSSGKTGEHTLNHYAVYLANEQWLKGEFQVTLFGPSEIYINNEKKLTYTETAKATKTIPCEFVPGKQTVIVKTVSEGGKAFALSFKVKEPESAAIAFSLSPKRGKNIYDILNGKHINRAELSPSGKYAIITLQNTVDGKTTTTTQICRSDNKEVVYAFDNYVQALKWIPGKDEISYLRKEGNGHSLYAYSPEKKQLQCLIKEDPEINNYTWSPDLSYLIYYKNENYAENDWKLRKLSGIEDRQPYYRYRSWLNKFDFATGLHSRLTWGNLTTSLMDISHDGSQLLFSTSRPDYTEYPYHKQSVYLLNLKNHRLDTLWENRTYSISCSFSPDDKHLLISGGPSAFGKTGENIGKNPIANQYDTQLYIYDIASKKVTPITKDFHPSVTQTDWRKDGKLYIVANDADYVRLFVYTNNKISRVNCPGDIIRSISIPENGDRMFYMASGVSSPAVVYERNLTNGETRVWENPSAAQYENIVFGDVKEWDYNYKKGTVIDGRYYLPTNFDPSKKYPLIVYYYGGTTPTERSFGGRYPFNLYAANGYVVYVLQPSGAIGYGQEFSARHQNNWGKITGNEIISATKAFLKAHPFIDATKVGCMGASYGGFTTMYLTTQTDIFTCAIAHAGISSITGYWGDSYWGYGYSTNATAHSFPWNRKDIYVDQSPLFNADKVNTPLLLIHGTKDVNVPTAQSMQFYTALKLLGKDAELVFVKDSDHVVVDYDLRILWNNTILAYFAKYLKGEPDWWKNIYKDKNL